MTAAGSAWSSPASAAGHRAGHRLSSATHRVSRSAHAPHSPWRLAARGGTLTTGALTGRASFYSGRRTASGGTVGAATCAHRWLPFGTRVLVTNLASRKQVVLTVNDRGPFVGGRIVDVSRAAAAMLGMLQAGVATVRMEVIGGSG